MFKTLYASKVAISEIISHCSSHSPCFCYMGLLAVPTKMPPLRASAFPIPFCLKIFPQIASHPVCSLTSFRSLFKYFLIREGLPIAQHKRARNDSNSPTIFPSTYHLAHLFCLLPVSPYCNVNFMMDPLNNHMAQNYYCHFQMAKLGGLRLQ